MPPGSTANSRPPSARVPWCASPSACPTDRPETSSSKRPGSAADACAVATERPTSSAPCPCRASAARRSSPRRRPHSRARVGLSAMSDGPLIVQSDRTVLLEVAHADAESARHELAIFAELERAPEHIHTYRITRLGLWNARAAGHTADDMLETLDRWSRFPVPPSVSVDLRETVNRYGRLVIERDDEGTLILRSSDPAVLAQVANNKRIHPLLIGHPTTETFVVDAWARGQ